MSQWPKSPSASERFSSAPISLAFSMNARDWVSSSRAGFVVFWRCVFFRIIGLIHGGGLPLKQFYEIVLTVVVFNGQWQFVDSYDLESNAFGRRF
jgi:hypothetical protein